MRNETTPTRSRFEYGRHNKFPVRYGWLGKGLARMDRSPTGFRDEPGAVLELGLGTKMVTSLRYWLEATALGTVRVAEGDSRKDKQLHTSQLGQVVLERDPYLEFPVTWWFIHLALARRDNSVFGWFFSDFRERMFDRATCSEAFIRHLKQNAAKEPGQKVAQDDVACVISAYASHSAPHRPDPEDGTASPLRELGLLLFHHDTKRYERTRPLDQPPLEAFVSCVALQAESLGQDSVSLGEMLGRRGGPGVIMGLGGDEIESMAARSAREYAGLGVTLDRLGAERRLRVPPMAGPQFWLDRHFQRLRSAA